MMRMHPETRPGLTLTEFIVVIVVTIVLFSFVILWLRQPRVDERRTQTLNNLKQIALACHEVQDVFGRLPPAWGTFQNAPGGSGSLHYHLLPFVEQDSLYRMYNPAAAVPPFVAPTDPSLRKKGGVQNFAAN